MMHCHDSNVIDIRDTENPAYTFDNMSSNEWQIVEETV